MLKTYTMDLRTVFSDSNDVVSNSSGVFCATVPNNSTAETHRSTSPELNPQPPPPPPSDITSLRLLSENLGSIFDASSPSSSSEHESYADARIVLADGRELAVHRCILAARSGFFRSVFKERSAGEEVRMKEVAKEYEVGVEAARAVLGYLYGGRVVPLPRGGVCACVDDDCPHLGCRPAVDFVLQVLYASSTFLVRDLAALCQRHLLDILDKVAIDDTLAILSVANTCGEICEGLLSRCTEMVVKSDVDITALEKSLPQPIAKRIVDRRAELGFGAPGSSSFPDKHVKRIHRALDSDDVELVRMLLKERHTNLDEACALHYAVAYCDAKTTAELLDLGLADVNRKNLRGHSVLHVAAMRREPKIIVSLLTKGARPADLTLDGRKALQISKRLTRAADYYKSAEEGKASSADRLCVEILEQAERREPLLGEASLSLAVAGDDLRMKMLYLENRVGLAKVLFPMEAKVVMDIAQVDGTSEFQLEDIYPPRMRGRKATTVDLNEAPFKMKEEHLVRMRALTRSVEIGKRFFPRCSEVLNKIMDADDLAQLACMGNDSPEERLAKRTRYMELQEILSKAFNEDKQEFDRSAMSSSSSSTSVGVVRPNNGKLAMKN